MKPEVKPIELPQIPRTRGDSTLWALTDDCRCNKRMKDVFGSPSVPSSSKPSRCSSSIGSKLMKSVENLPYQQKDSLGFSRSLDSLILSYSFWKVITLPNSDQSQASNTSPQELNCSLLRRPQLQPSMIVLMQQREEGAKSQLIHSVVSKMYSLSVMFAVTLSLSQPVMVSFKLIIESSRYLEQFCALGKTSCERNPQRKALVWSKASSKPVSYSGFSSSTSMTASSVCFR